MHRDVKPGNILVAPAGSAAARLAATTSTSPTSGSPSAPSELSGGLTGTGHFLGTVDYVAPEQIQGRPVGPGTDIYALGCVLYECLTGQLPFRRDDDAALLWAHLVEPPPPVTATRPELPAAVNAVVARAMAKDPEDRYESCEELLQELELPSACRRPRAVPPPVDRRQRRGDGRPGPGPGVGAVAGYSLGIDLGTTFVAAALADDRGSRCSPSATARW